MCNEENENTCIACRDHFTAYVDDIDCHDVLNNNKEYPGIKNAFDHIYDCTGCNTHSEYKTERKRIFDQKIQKCKEDDCKTCADTLEAFAKNTIKEDCKSINQLLKTNGKDLLGQFYKSDKCSNIDKKCKQTIKDYANTYIQNHKNDWTAQCAAEEAAKVCKTCVADFDTEFGTWADDQQVADLCSNMNDLSTFVVNEFVNPFYSNHAECKKQCTQKINTGVETYIKNNKATWKKKCADAEKQAKIDAACNACATKFDTEFGTWADDQQVADLCSNMNDLSTFVVNEFVNPFYSNHAECKKQCTQKINTGVETYIKNNKATWKKKCADAEKQAKIDAAAAEEARRQQQHAATCKTCVDKFDTWADKNIDESSLCSTIDNVDANQFINLFYTNHADCKKQCTQEINTGVNAYINKNKATWKKKCADAEKQAKIDAAAAEEARRQQQHAATCKTCVDKFDTWADKNIDESSLCSTIDNVDANQFINLFYTNHADCKKQCTQEINTGVQTYIIKNKATWKTECDAARQKEAKAARLKELQRKDKVAREARLREQQRKKEAADKAARQKKNCDACPQNVIAYVDKHISCKYINSASVSDIDGINIDDICTDITDTCKSEVIAKAKGYFKQNKQKWTDDCLEKQQPQEESTQCIKCKPAIENWLEKHGKCEKSLGDNLDEFMLSVPECGDCLDQITQNDFQEYCGGKY